MKKNKKLLIIVASITVVLVGLLIFLLVYKPSSEPEKIDTGVSMSTSTNDEGIHQAKINVDKDGKIKNNSYGTLLKYDTNKVDKINLENNSGTIDIVSTTPKKSDGTSESTVYKIVGYDNLALQDGVVDQIATACASLEFSEVMTLDKDKGKDYGFDKPTATVNVSYKDKTKSIIIVGDNAPQNKGTYIKFGNDDTVYLVKTEAVKPFTTSLTEMVSLTINDSAKDTDKSKASSITLSGTNYSKNVVLTPNTDTNINATYKITQPEKRYADETEVSKVDGAIRGLYAESVKMINPSKKQLDSLGLSNPYATVNAVYPDTTVSVSATKPNSNGKVYLICGDNNIVYEMASSSLPWVTSSYEKLASQFVLQPKMISVSKMTVNNGKKTYTFDVSSKEVKTTDKDGNETSSNTTTVNYGNKEIESAYFSTFFDNVTSTQLVDINSSSTSGSPAFTVSYTYANGNGTDTVKFYKSNNGKYVATVNDVVMGHIYQTNISKLISQVESVANNKKVSSF